MRSSRPCTVYDVGFVPPIQDETAEQIAVRERLRELLAGPARLTRCMICVG